MTGLAKPTMSIHPMASPTVCLVSIEVSSLTVTSDCSCLVCISFCQVHHMGALGLVLHQAFQVFEGVHLSVCVQALARTFYNVHLHSAEPSLGLGRPKWWRLQLQQHPACCRRAPLSNDHSSSQANLPLYSRLSPQVDLSFQRIWCNRVTFPPAHPLLCHYQECSILAIWQQTSPKCHEKLLICHLQNVQNVQNIPTNTSYGPSSTLFDSSEAP